MTTSNAGAPPAQHGLLRGAGLVGLGMAFMNVAAYGFTLVAVHALAPSDFGALTALLGLIMIGTVASLGLQATGARRIATYSGTEQHVLAESLLRAGKLAALGLMILAAAATPLILVLLHIDSVVAVLLLAPQLGLLTLYGAQLGVLQGGQHWRELALVYAVVGVGRLGCGGLGVYLWPSVTGAMAGIVAGTVLPVLVAAFLLRGSAGGHPAEVRQIIQETVHGTHALAAFFVFANTDVLLARAFMDGDDSGIYAAGVIIAKACLFLPQFVSVVVFPSLASNPDDRRRLRNAILVVAGLGACAVAGTLILPDLVVRVVGGDAYAAIGPRAWLFALAGSAYAVLQLVVYAAIARRDRYVALVQWLGLAVFVASASVILGGHFAVGMAGINALVAMAATVAITLSVLLGSGVQGKSPDA